MRTFQRRAAVLALSLLSTSVGAVGLPSATASAAPSSTAAHAFDGRFTGKVRIAAVQTDPVLGAKAENLADMQVRTRAAAAEGADLVVFPELSLTGYKYRTIAEMAPDAEPVPGPSTAAMAATAKETGTHIAFGLVEEDDGKFYDTVVLVGPEGYIGKYAKITMGHHSEAVLFTRGPKQPPVFETAIGRIGLASCYDGAFPENARMMALQGAQIMVLSNAENGSTWREYIRTRAYENNAFAVVANRVGTERNSTFNGDSIVAGPDYSILADAGNTAVETVYATVDLSEASSEYVGQRRPELYRALTRSQAPAVLGVSAEPQSAVAGSRSGSDVLVSTTAIGTGTEIEAEIVTGDGAVVAADEATVGVDQARLRLEVPADAPVGAHRLRVRSAGSVKEIPFTVKATERPGPLGTMPDTSASLASTIYVGFDTELAADAEVPVTVSGAGRTHTFVGRVNTGNVDNRVTVPYSGLVADTTYTVTLPAGSVADAASGATNEEVRFEFTTAAAPRTVATAVAQFDQVAGDPAANVAAMSAQVDQAAAAGTQLVAFGQLAVPGTGLDAAALRAVAEPLDGPSVAALAAKSAETGVSIAFGLAERDGDRIYDTTVLVGPSGILGSHRSTQLADDQLEVFTAGDAVAPVLDTPLGPVGLFSGHELIFPEVIRSLAIRGALVVVGGVDAQTGTWREIARSRGSENKVYVVAANTDESGGSLITRTSRGIDAQLGAGAGQAVFALNLTTIANRYYTYVDASTAKARTTHYFLDRRPEIYAALSARSSSTTSMSLDRPVATLGGPALTAAVTVTPGPDASGEGVVEVRAGSTLLGTAELRGGTARVAIPTSRLRAGSLALVATYLGSDDLALSSSERVALNVRKAAAKVTVRKPKRVQAGKRSSLTVRVSARGVAATGKVTVSVAGKTRAAALSAGQARVTLPRLKPGTRTVVVTYRGSDLVESKKLRLPLRVRR